jgi:hypothetical protein
LKKLFIKELLHILTRVVSLGRKKYDVSLFRVVVGCDDTSVVVDGSSSIIVVVSVVVLVVVVGGLRLQST